MQQPINWYRLLLLLATVNCLILQSTQWRVDGAERVVRFSKLKYITESSKQLAITLRMIMLLIVSEFRRNFYAKIFCRIRFQTLHDICMKSCLPSGVSVNSDSSSWAFGPIKSSAVYIDVTSLSCTVPSLGKWRLNHAKLRVCCAVGPTKKYLSSNEYVQSPIVCWRTENTPKNMFKHIIAKVLANSVRSSSLNCKLMSFEHLFIQSSKDLRLHANVFNSCVQVPVLICKRAKNAAATLI